MVVIAYAAYAAARFFLAAPNSLVARDYSFEECALNLLHDGHDRVLVLVLQHLLASRCKEDFVFDILNLLALHTVMLIKPPNNNFATFRCGHINILVHLILAKCELM